jgi:hypothetical protein
MRTTIWSGQTIRYERQEPARDYAGVTLIHSSEYLTPAGEMRYVAIRAGEVIAVAIREGFCQMCVNPLFDGSMQGCFPYFEKPVNGRYTSYVIPYAGREVLTKDPQEAR